MSEKEYMTQREIFAECDRLVARRDKLRNMAYVYIRDIETIERTLKLFKEYYRLVLQEEQAKELNRLNEELSNYAFCYYWGAVVANKKFEDLWNANKPFVFS